MALLPASFRQEYIVCISISGSAALQSPATACNRSAIGGHCTAGNTNILTPLNDQCTERGLYPLVSATSFPVLNPPKIYYCQFAHAFAMLWSAKLAVLRQFHKISNQCTVRYGF